MDVSRASGGVRTVRGPKKGRASSHYPPACGNPRRCAWVGGFRLRGCWLGPPGESSGGGSRQFRAPSWVPLRASRGSRVVSRGLPEAHGFDFRLAVPLLGRSWDRSWGRMGACFSAVPAVLGPSWFAPGRSRGLLGPARGGRGGHSSRMRAKRIEQSYRHRSIFGGALLGSFLEAVWGVLEAVPGRRGALFGVLRRLRAVLEASGAAWVGPLAAMEAPGTPVQSALCEMWRPRRRPIVSTSLWPRLIGSKGLKSLPVAFGSVLWP